MARTKNRGLQQSFSPSYTVRRWRLGAYIRLSKEDLKKGKDDSNSVINQRDLLNDFYQKHIGEFESVSVYVDDSPSFQPYFILSHCLLGFYPPYYLSYIKGSILFYKKP